MKRSVGNLFVTICLMALCAVFAPTSARAASEARAALERVVTQVMAELNKPELKNPATRDAVLNRVEKIIVTLFSPEELSMRTVGPNWRNFTPDQKKRFADAFEDLLRERYTGALEGYAGETVSYTGEAPIGGKNDRVQIDTTVNIKNKPVPVSYRMVKKDRWVVYDMIIEGVSLVQNYRSQFQSVLQKGDAEELIALVRAKAAETRAQQGK